MALMVTVLSNTGCGMVWAFYGETFPPDGFSRIRVVGAEDEHILPDATVSFELLAMRKGFEMWPATLLQDSQPIQPPRPVGKPAAGTAIVVASGGVTVGGPSVSRPFPPGDPNARFARLLEVTRLADGDFAVAPCRVVAASQWVAPLNSEFGPYIEYIHCAVVKVKAPSRPELALWFIASERFASRWRSDEKLYWAYRLQAAREGVFLEGGIESMPRESGWCEIQNQVLTFHLVKRTQ